MYVSWLKIANLCVCVCAVIFLQPLHNYRVCHVRSVFGILCVIQRLEVLHDDYVARLQSAEQDQEELRHEVWC